MDQQTTQQRNEAGLPVNENGRPIIVAPKPYRQMSPEELALFDETVELGKRIQTHCAKVRKFIDERHAVSADAVRNGRAMPDHEHITKVHANNDLNPNRWAAQGVTSMQNGLMQLKRAISAPDFF